MRSQISGPSAWIDLGCDGFEAKALSAAPLAARLLQARASESCSFHMPGHFAGHAFSSALAAAFFQADTTELATTGDLNEPEGAVLAAQKEAARAFGAEETLFLTGGSTSGIQALMLAVCGRGGRLVTGAAVHKSVFHTAALFGIELIVAGTRPEADIAPAVSAGPVPVVGTAPVAGSAPVVSTDPVAGTAQADQNPLPALRPQDLALMLEELSRETAGLPQAVLVTSPDYYGCCLDIAGIAAVCHSFGLPLLVDEAHGAHLAFAPSLLPPTALSQGADAVVQSAHKTLPALTPAALLHLGKGSQVDGPTLWRAVRLLRTSSPSLLIAATIDYARAVMELRGAAPYAKIRQAITGLADRLRLPYRVWDAGPSRDLSRLVIDTAEVGPAPEVARHLAAQGVLIEFADVCRLVLIVSPFATEAAFDELRQALDGFSGGRAQTSPAKLRSLDSRLRCLYQHPIQRLDLAPALDDGQLDIVCIYPPGIPIRWPGCEAGAEQTALLDELQGLGLEVQSLGQ